MHMYVIALLTAKNEILELLINSKIHKEVSKVINEQDVAHVLIHSDVRELQDRGRQVRDYGQNHETRSNLDRLHVLLVCVLVLSGNISTENTEVLHSLITNYSYTCIQIIQFYGMYGVQTKLVCVPVVFHCTQFPISTGQLNDDRHVQTHRSKQRHSKEDPAENFDREWNGWVESKQSISYDVQDAEYNLSDGKPDFERTQLRGNQTEFVWKRNSQEAIDCEVERRDEIVTENYESETKFNPA